MPPFDWKLVSLEAAWDALLAEARPGGTERVTLASAAGRVLAEPVVAGIDYPAFDKALMDGFAIRAADTVNGPVELRIVGEASAGAVAATGIAPGEAIRINTGAPLPHNADAVVPIEVVLVVERDRSAVVTVPVGVTPGANVAPRGQSARAGDVVLAPRIRIGPAHLSAAATVGAAEISVYRRPTLAILPTGDEIVPVGSAPGPGQIFDSNGPMLAALAAACGATPVELSGVRDAPDALRTALSRGLEHPILVSVGGMSKGTLDLVPTLAAELGVAWRFHGVDLRPGKPTAYGVGPGGQQVFGLPGNPVSALVCFLLFVRPAIDALAGLPPRRPTLWPARLAEPISARRDKRPAFIPAQVEPATDGSIARLVQWHGSGDPFGPARAHGFVFQPRGDAPLAAGDWVSVLPIPGAAELTIGG